MNESDARLWLMERYGSKVFERLQCYAELLVAESQRQNLIATSTIPYLWTRHFLDSAQLVDWAPSGWQHWVDVGAGAGLPGVVVAILTGKPVTMIEPRRLRIDFMRECAEKLELDNASVVLGRAQNVKLNFFADVISARAVASLDAIFTGCQQFTIRATTYLLPKGRSAESEVAVARRSWQGVFHVKQSIVDPTSGIVIASGVSPR